MHLASLKKYTKIIALVFLALVVTGGILILGKGTTQNLMSRASSCGVDKISSTQVSANSAVITWESADVNQGSVLYGINVNNLSFTAPEGSSGKTHNVPLTLLTPNTVYYYLISVGGKKCDSSGQSCDATCVPWSFTTAGVTPQTQIIAPILSPTVAATPSASVTGSLNPTPSSAVSITAGPTASAGAALSAFCQQVKANVGASSADTANWETVKQYDVNGDGRINSLDVLKCPKTGK